jgi:hypothetical protein
LKHLVKKGEITGVFIGAGQFVCVDERIVDAAASLAAEQGTLSVTDLLKIVQ